MAHLLARQLRRRGHAVQEEPTVPVVDGTFIKPDLVVEVNSTEKRLLAADVTVCQDGAESMAFEAKRKKYGEGAAGAALGNLAGRSGCFFGGRGSVVPVVLTNRAFLSHASAKILRGLGLTSRDLLHLIITTLNGSIRVHAAYHMTTFRR